MLFNSAEFIFVFVPVALSGFFLLGWMGAQASAVIWLALASLVFYGWHDPYRLLPIILVSIVFNFAIARMLARWRRSTLLGLGVVGNLALLGYFKYGGFLLEIYGGVSGIATAKPDILLPIGIS